MDDPRLWPEAAGGDARAARAHIDKLHFTNGDVVELPATGVTAIVGANNAGKSTLLRQVDVYLRNGSSDLARQEPRLLDSVDLSRNLHGADLLHWFAENAVLIENEEHNGGDYFSLNQQTFNAWSLRQGSYAHVVNQLSDLYGAFVFFADATSRLQYAFAGQAKNEFDDPPQTALQRFSEDRELFRGLSDLARRIFGKNLTLDDHTGPSSIRIRVGETAIPAPGRSEPLGQYGVALRDLPLLGNQGDGMKSFFGLMIPALAESRQIILVDEPEAFLHPPQARALGRELGLTAKTLGQQVMVATHSKDILSGLLDSEAEMTVVRLHRDEKSTRRTQPGRDNLLRLRDDRLLRYSNVLNGLFAQLVVLCESEQDCRFYEAALEAYVAAHGSDPGVHTIPASDVLFIPANGKGGFVNFLPSLNELAVPTVVVADIDLLKSGADTRSVFKALGGDWDNAKRNFTVATDWLRTEKKAQQAQSVLAAVTAVLAPIVEANAYAVFDGTTRQTVQDLLKSSDDPWSTVKRVGLPAFNGDARIAFEALSETLADQGLALVQVGELEGFAPQFKKGKDWLMKAVETGSYALPPAQNLIRTVMHFHERRIAS